MATLLSVDTTDGQSYVNWDLASTVELIPATDEQGHPAVTVAVVSADGKRHASTTRIEPHTALLVMKYIDAFVPKAAAADGFAVLEDLLTDPVDPAAASNRGGDHADAV